MKKRLIIIAMLIVIAVAFAFELYPRVITPDLIQSNGAILAQVLDHYRADHGTYPTYLSELVPNYVADLREPPSMWGWLYQNAGADYRLGYVSSVDKLGYFVCVYSPSAPQWDCNLTNEFHLPPTPSSDP